MTKRVSVITPTADRQHFLEGAYRLLQAQHYPDWEWLIYDTSLRLTEWSDPRITYFYDEQNISIGEKRNYLTKQATGDLIIHFDDDDYYSPTYLDRVVKALKSNDFFTLHSWFTFDVKTNQIYYRAGEEQGDKRFVINPLMGTNVCEIELGPEMDKQKEKIKLHGKIGYGFSFAYRKEVADHCSFPDLDLGEDWHFYHHVEEGGYRIVMEGDQKGEVIHVMHDTNTASEYPQYRVPHFLVKNLFSDFFIHLERTNENRLSDWR